MATCIVSFVDTLGFRHTVEVQLTPCLKQVCWLFEPSSRAAAPPGYVCGLEVEIRSPVKHIVTPKRIQEWLEGGAKSLKEGVMKERG